MRQTSLLILFLIVFIDFVCFGIVLPNLPFYSQSYGANAFQIGWLFACYTLMQFVLSPVWGAISDYVGRKPVIVICLLATSLSMVLLGLAGSLRWLFIARIMAGACAGSLTAAYAYVVDVTPVDERGRSTGFLDAAFGLGFIFGPSIGGMLSRYGYALPMFIAALLTFLNAIFALIKLQEPRLSPEVRASHRYRRFNFKAIPIALGHSQTRLAILCTLLFTVAVGQMESIAAIYMNLRHDYDAESVGVILSLMGLMIVLCQSRVALRWTRLQGEVKLMILGSLLACIMLALFATTQSALIAAGSMVLLALGQGVAKPSLTALAGEASAMTQRGSTIGVFQSAGSIARIVGPPCAGWFFDRMSWRAPFYGGSASLLICSAVGMLWYLQNRKAKDSQAFTAAR